MWKKKYNVKYIVAVLATEIHQSLCACDNISLPTSHLSNYYWTPLAISFLTLPVLLSVIDSDLTKSLIDRSRLFPPLVCLPSSPGGLDLVITQKHTLVVYVGVTGSDELQMWILLILPCRLPVADFGFRLRQADHMKCHI